MEPATGFNQQDHNNVWNIWQKTSVHLARNWSYMTCGSQLNWLNFKKHDPSLFQLHSFSPQLKRMRSSRRNSQWDLCLFLWGLLCLQVFIAKLTWSQTIHPQSPSLSKTLGFAVSSGLQWRLFNLETILLTWSICSCDHADYHFWHLFSVACWKTNMISNNSSIITFFINKWHSSLSYFITVHCSVACGATMSQNNSYAIISSYSTRFFVFSVFQCFSVFVLFFANE